MSSRNCLRKGKHDDAKRRAREQESHFLGERERGRERAKGGERHEQTHRDGGRERLDKIGGEEEQKQRRSEG